MSRIGLHTQSTNPDVAQALIGAALLSLLVYPTVATLLLARRVVAAERSAHARQLE
jgi:hypothetical protein